MPISAADPLLDIAGLSSGYGKIGVLHGVNLTIGTGEVVALLGPNGAGKTTLLRAVSGLLPWSGSVRFAGRDLAGASPRDIVKSGLAHVVEGHRVFTQLAVLDNLLLAAYDLPRGERTARVEEALELFPEIAAKRHERAAALSGGQQQILAVAQGLVRRPRLLMLDEPSAGLSPVLVDRVLVVVRRLREAGTAVLLVEQLIEKALALADRVYALARGAIVLEAGTGEADLPHRLEHAYLATAHRTNGGGIMNDYPGASWLARYRERVNGDPELDVIGEWFNTTLTLTFGDNRFALKIAKGKIADIIASPRLDVRAAFGFAAPVDVWKKFLSPDPPPLYHDFFAMLMRVPEFPPGGRQPRRDAECARLASPDEHHAGNRDARCLNSSRSPAATSLSTSPANGSGFSSKRLAAACRSFACTRRVTTAGNSVT